MLLQCFVTRDTQSTVVDFFCCTNLFYIYLKIRRNGTGDSPAKFPLSNYEKPHTDGQSIRNINDIFVTLHSEIKNIKKRYDSGKQKLFIFALKKHRVHAQRHFAIPANRFIVVSCLQCFKHVLCRSTTAFRHVTNLYERFTFTIVTMRRISMNLDVKTIKIK